MRSRGGLITGIVFGVLLLLCAGGGIGAFALVSSLEGRGADTPAIATDTLMKGIFLEQDADTARKYLCQEVNPTAIEQKIDEVHDLLNRQPGTQFSWDSTEKSRSKIKAVLDVHLEIRSSDHMNRSQRYEITVESNGGWRVCGLKRVAS